MIYLITTDGILANGYLEQDPTGDETSSGSDGTMGLTSPDAC